MDELERRDAVVRRKAFGSGGVCVAPRATAGIQWAAWVCGPFRFAAGGEENTLRVGRSAAWFLVAVIVIGMLVGCARSTEPLPVFLVPPRSVVASRTSSQEASIGLVLAGGGVFGAWGVGALQAFFDDWQARYGEEPPIRVVAGTSTGALIAPFAFMGRRPEEDAIAELVEWYTNVSQADIIAPRVGVVLPFPLFAMTTPSVYDAGYTTDPRSARRLYAMLLKAVSDRKIDTMAGEWPRRRLGAATMDFSTGRPDVYTNQPDRIRCLRTGILASAMAPLVLPPIPLPSADCRPTASLSPHLDGGIYAVAPFGALFDLAALEPAIPLTHVVVIQAFPVFPGDEGGAIQAERFPVNPRFRAIADRMTTLLSESTASTESALVRASLALRRAGVDSAEVLRLSGFRILDPVPELVELVPTGRLGWKAFEFRREAMRRMYRRGYEEASATLHRRRVK